jgi:hypothetical protein
LKISTSLAAAIALASISAGAFAQTVTLDYQNDLVSGTYTSLPSGTATSNPITVSLPEASFTGSLSGALTYSVAYSPSAGFNIYTLAAEQFTLTGANGTQLVFEDGPSPLSFFGPLPNSADIGFFDSAGDSTYVQTLNGNPTGATVNIQDNAYHGSPTQLNIGASGVSASYEWATLNGTCNNQFEPANSSGGASYVYNGSGIPVCSLTATSSSPGTWTVATANAPEIDPGMAGSALTLLAGFAAMMRGRRRVAA